jgi:AcrR family transcriptional regulator
MPAARVRKNGPRRLGRPPASESAETRERILSAARSCFAEFGYASTTNREIGGRAGLTAGAIYHYFDSKVQLFAAVTEQVVTRIFDEFEEVIVSSPRFVERVRALLDVAVVLHRDDASLARFSTIYPVELLRHQELAAQIPVDLWDRGISFFARLAEEAIENGELAPDVAATDVANMLLAVTTGLAHFATLDQSLERHRAAVILVERLFDGSLMPARD